MACCSSTSLLILITQLSRSIAAYFAGYDISNASNAGSSSVHRDLTSERTARHFYSSTISFQGFGQLTLTTIPHHTLSGFGNPGVS